MRAGSWPAGARSPFEARSSPYAGEGRDGARPSSRRRIDETSPDSDPPQVPGSGTAVTAIPSLASLEWRLGVVESRQLELLTFREEVTTELKRNNPEVMLLTEQGAETRRKLEDLQSSVARIGVELGQGLQPGLQPSSIARWILHANPPEICD